MDYTKVLCNHIYIGMFVSRTKGQMQSGVKSGANTLYIHNSYWMLICVQQRLRASLCLDIKIAEGQ